jgi:dienelactone hydrolase
MRRLAIATTATFLIVGLASVNAADLDNGALSIPSGEAPGASPDKLWAYYWRPDAPPGTNGRYPAVVMLHGCGGIYSRGGDRNLRHKQWQQAFNAEGYVVLEVDSFSTRGVTEICTRRDRPVTVTGERRRDALAGLAFLRGVAVVDPDRIALVGWSNGGSTVLATMEGNGEKGFRAAVAFYPGCRLSLGRDLRLDGPLLVLHGALDDWTPPGQCDTTIAEAMERGVTVERQIYPHAYHNFDYPDLAKRVLQNVASTSSHTATLATDSEARADALTRVPAFLARYMRD